MLRRMERKERKVSTNEGIKDQRRDHPRDEGKNQLKTFIGFFDFKKVFFIFGKVDNI